MASLLDNIIGSLTSGGSNEKIAKKTGASSDQVSDLLSAAVPALLESMHKNASDEKGAKALDEALEKHAKKGKKSAEELLDEADDSDGEKIINHILGSDTKHVKSGLAKKTGLDSEQVSSILAVAAPAIMNMVGNQKKEKGHDASGLTDLLGGLLGGSSKKSGGLDLGSLISLATKDKDGDGKPDLLGALSGLTGLLTGK